MGSSGMKSVKAVLVDLSGTIHIENSCTPGALEALQRLRKTQLRLKFVTNTTKESRSFLHARLSKLGFDIRPEEIFTSLSAARSLIEKENLKPMLMVDDKALEDFKGLTDFEGTPDAVVIGLAPDLFDRKHLNQAFRRILHDKARLIAVHEARYYMRSDGLALGPGPFVKMLEYATGVSATVVGKPSANFFRAALDGVNPEEAVMIGDDARDDIGGAQAIGIRGYLVRTGKYRPGDETKIDPQPYQTVDNFSQAVDHIIDSLESK